MLHTRNPVAKACELIARYGTPSDALAFAKACRDQHDENTASRTFWDATCEAIRVRSGKPHTRKEKRKRRKFRTFADALAA